MKNRILRKITLSALTSLVLTLSFLISPVSIGAATVYKPDVASPSAGNIFISKPGTFTTVSKQSVINRINTIRKEACTQGVINPDTGKKLTLQDYKPVSWSSVLEDYARLRATETTVYWDHQRPSNKSTFKNNSTKSLNGYHSGENIAAGYSLLNSIEAYYEEKADWVKKTGGMTGHYENIIRPKNTLVGMAGFRDEGYEYSAMEFGVPYGSNNANQSSVTGAANQLIEVNVAFLVKSVSIKGSSNVAAGKSIKLTAVVNMIDETPKADVYQGAVWSSSNTAIATVDKNGNVKGLKAGTVTIKANVGGKVGSKTIKVDPGTLVTSIKLNSTSKSLIKGQSFTLTVTVAPTNAANKKVTYKSSNKNVATVDANGKVTAKSAGTATITVTASDGSKKTATAKITVTNPVKVSSLTLNKTSQTIYKGYTFSLKVTVAPTNANNKNVTYKSSNTNVATVNSNGKITAKATGTAIITVTAADGSGKTATCKVTVKNPVRVTGVKLNSTKITLNKGKTYQLSAIIAPTNATNKNVTWISSNTKVAKIDSNGKVVAVAPGDVIITAKTKDGGKIAICKVTVKK